MVRLNGSSTVDPDKGGFHLPMMAGVVLTPRSLVALLASLVLLAHTTVCQDVPLLLLASLL